VINVSYLWLKETPCLYTSYDIISHGHKSSQLPSLCSMSVDRTYVHLPQLTTQ